MRLINSENTIFYMKNYENNHFRSNPGLLKIMIFFKYKKSDLFDLNHFFIIFFNNKIKESLIHKNH